MRTVVSLVFIGAMACGLVTTMGGEPDLAIAGQAGVPRVTAEGAWAVPIELAIVNEGSEAASDFALAAFSDSGGQLPLLVPGQATAWHPKVTTVDGGSEAVLKGEVFVDDRSRLDQTFWVHVDHCRLGEQPPCAVVESNESNNAVRVDFAPRLASGSFDRRPGR